MRDEPEEVDDPCDPRNTPAVIVAMFAVAVVVMCVAMLAKVLAMP